MKEVDVYIDKPRERGEDGSGGDFSHDLFPTFFSCCFGYFRPMTKRHSMIWIPDMDVDIDRCG